MKTFNLYFLFCGLYLAGCIAGLVGCADTIETQPAGNPNKGLIIYTQWDQLNKGTPEIIKIVDTSGALRQTIGSASDPAILCSAAGGKIAYVTSSAFGNPDSMTLIVAQNDNSNPRVIYTQQIKKQQLRVLSIVLSPDGTKVTFATLDSGATRSNLYVANTDGTGSHLVTDRFNIQTTPCFSEDGLNIVYYTSDNINSSWLSSTLEIAGTSVGGARSLCSIDEVGADGAGIIVWRHGSMQIAFTDHRGIYVIDAGGSSAKQFVDSGGTPVWSPDGSQLAYAGLMKPNDNIDIFITGDLGKTKTNISNDGLRFEAYPSWSNDGTKLVCITWAGDYEHATSSLELLDIRSKQKTTLATPGMIGYFLQ
ncbi:MAG: hypothetical protein Q8919_04880 [Bacteroidota bacterium]|nr:hypothetical protein [Bacteroidota bacterium]